MMWWGDGFGMGGGWLLGGLMMLLFWAVVVGLPGLVATAGALVWMKRRS